MTKIKKLISAMVTGCMIVSALMMHVGAVNAQSNDSLLNNNLHSTSTSQAEAILNNAIYRDYLIRVGEYQANDDGSYLLRESHLLPLVLLTVHSQKKF